MVGKKDTEDKVDNIKEGVEIPSLFLCSKKSERRLSIKTERLL